MDLAYDALINEVDAGKMRVFLSDVMFDRETDGRTGKKIPIPFGKGDCTVFRKVMSTEDTITEFRRSGPTRRARPSASPCRCWATSAGWGPTTSTSTRSAT